MIAHLSSVPVSAASAQRYGWLSMVLHWIMAALILIQLGLGWYMNEVLPDHSRAQDQVQAIHVSVGLTLLILVVARIGVRLTHPAPPLPASLSTWERWLARFTHTLFYVLILVLPLTGWALLSVRAEPIAFWGVPWPALPGLRGLAHDQAHSVGRSLKSIHIFWLIWIVVINLGLHVAGALKHQFDGHAVLWRMVPFLRRPAERAAPMSSPTLGR